jgi:hypothetical protein
MEETDSSQFGKFPPKRTASRPRNSLQFPPTQTQISQHQNAVAAFQTGKPILTHFLSVTNRHAHYFTIFE